MVQSNPLLAIVILNYNGRHYLEKFLPSVLASSYPNKKIIVGDNASTDDSVRWLAARYPEIEILQNDENYGFAKGYNQVLKRVKADYFVLLNSDVEVTAGWIEPVLQLMQGDSIIAACQPKILSYASKSTFEYAGAAGGWIDVLGYPFARGRVFDVCEEDTGQYDVAAPVFWASGAALFIKAHLFIEAGGFDEYFFAHQEEIDLCWRLQKAGYTIMACPQSVVYHVGAGTLPKGRRKVFLNLRNNLVMLSKNWSLAEKLWKLPCRVGLDAVAAYRSLFAGDTVFYSAVFKAHVAFLVWLISHKKTRHMSRVKPACIQGVYKRSLVFQYFIKGKKTFDEIVGETQ